MKITRILLFALAATLLLASCGGSSGKKDPTPSTATTKDTAQSTATANNTTVSAPESSTPDQPGTSSLPTVSSEVSNSPSTVEPSVPSTTESPVEQMNIKATITSTTNDYTVTEEGTDTITIKAKKRPAAGDKVEVTIPDNHYLKIQNKYFSDTIVYLPDGVFTYTFSSNSSVYMPTTFCNSSMTFTFSIPTAEELSEQRNVALNPYDADKNTVGFPHASSNNVYDTSGQFIPRNAIDGFSSNSAHGNYPYQSWGPKSTVKATDHFTIDFGREVKVSSIVLALRADGFGSANAHDAYFSTIVLEFSDGSTETINPEKVKDLQTFSFDEKTTTYVKLTGFVTDKTDSQGWAAITEIQIHGCEALTAES